MAYLLGIDIGTSGTKALVCDTKGKVLATAMAEHGISSPQPGWSEQDPNEWWSTVIASTKAVLKKAKAEATKEAQSILDNAKAGLADQEKQMAASLKDLTVATTRKLLLDSLSEKEVKSITNSMVKKLK